MARRTKRRAPKKVVLTQDEAIDIYNALGDPGGSREAWARIRRAHQILGDKIDERYHQERDEREFKDDYGSPD